MPNVLIVGATRGLGLELAKQYASRPDTTVYGTSRGPTPPATDSPEGVRWIPDIDLTTESSAGAVARALSGAVVDLTVISAGYFGQESLSSPSWGKQVAMYATSSIAPVFLVHEMFRAGALPRGSKLVLVSSEAGSVALRHESEGGGNYGHHASKAALNMVGKLLSLDLKEHGVAVALVHPGFMRTEMTAGVGFDRYWDSGGAVHPDVAAKALVDFIETFDLSKTGTFWAPRGAGDIGTAEQTLGPKEKLSTPLELPW